MRKDIQEVLLDEETLAKRIKEMGEQISKDYEGKEVIVIGILKGSVIFVADLVREVTVPVSFDFMAVSSYGNRTTTTGTVRILKDLDYDIEGKHVLIVEDIIDSGVTLSYLIEHLAGRKPASLKLCTLLNKPERRKVEVKVDYIGFTVPDAFLVGFGLDYAEKYRNLPFIGILKEEIYA
ncbi:MULTISPECIES: hypoxanthine phosphoribosyltransferase [Anaerosinus]|uniref:Hypoxanthine phosphoribosyltransferase n=1 Tax=Selenobaculum gibii TaxID=3054208 RepID=A0A9Y2AJQ8_9FIRM|nr:hypoxanthine phosphoribosyltransferase [Selenobaculum gbiensis]WIW71351.1 hypoxanthine phosphoribosyltransferase [Selenobaculum gbiensis]